MEHAGKLKNIAAMTIFGTIGIFVKYIPFPSSFIAMIRGFVGFAVLFLATSIIGGTGKKESGRSFKITPANVLLLFVSGGFIGINWILLFEAYSYTTVATATLCYYLAPVFVILLSPLLRERLTAKKVICVIVALIGMAFVSGIPSGGLPDISELKGILLGTGAAAFYAAVVLFNMKLGGVPATVKTMLQLISAAIVVCPYVLMTQDVLSFEYSVKSVLLLLVVGIIHTGIAYLLYFDSLSGLKAQTVSILGYIDPVVAIILSIVILGEPMTPYNAIGAVLILGATLVSELDFGSCLKAKKDGEGK